MSSINVWLEPERVLVGTDTLSTPLDGSANHHISKCAVLPLAKTVIAGRGTSLGLQLVAYVLNQMRNIEDFDSAVAAMPDTLQQAFQMIAANGPKFYAHDPANLQEQEILIAGWSGHAGRMRAIRWAQDRSIAGFERIDIAEPGFVTPWEGAEPDYFPGDVEGMRHVLSDQVQQSQRKYGCDAHGREIAVGGSLVLVEITRTSLTVTTHELPPITRVITERPPMWRPVHLPPRPA